MPDRKPVPEDSPGKPVPKDSPGKPVPEDSHAVLRERIRGLRMLLGLIILLGLAALLAAARSAPRGTGDRSDLAGHLALWLLAQVLLLVLIVQGLRWLRRRRLGPSPSTRLRRPSDVLLHLDAGLGGLVALLGFGPAVLTGHAGPLDLAIAATGLVLLTLGLRAALLHVTRP